MLIMSLATLALFLFWVWEYLRHRANILRIPIRIHVNGTRGKSSVTRLIAAGLRAGGIATVGKTTGTLPRIILPDGTEAAIVRLSGANIIEQKYITRYIQPVKPKALVIECMAVNPAYQWITERLFVKSTVSVITNSRLDHTDLMGETMDSITNSLCNTIPEHGVCFTAEDKYFGTMKHVAQKRNTKIHCIRPTDVTTDEIMGFSYIEHAENIQLSLAVCQHVGVPRAVALKGMQQATPDPGALKKYVVNEKGREVQFYNVFAANDPDSTRFIYGSIAQHLKNNQQKMIILNCRADRHYRSVQLLEVCKDLDFDYLLITGELPDKVYQAALDMGLPKDRLVKLGEIDPQLVYQKTWELTKKESHVMGIGNIAGDRKYGGQIVKYYRTKSQGGI